MRSRSRRGAFSRDSARATRAASARLRPIVSRRSKWRTAPRTRRTLAATLRSTIELFGERGGHDGSLSRCTQEAEVPRADTPRRWDRASQRRDCSSSSASWCRSSSNRTSAGGPFRRRRPSTPAALTGGHPGLRLSFDHDDATPVARPAWAAGGAGEPLRVGFPGGDVFGRSPRLSGWKPGGSSAAPVREGDVGTRDDSPGKWCRSIVASRLWGPRQGVVVTSDRSSYCSAS